MGRVRVRGSDPGRPPHATPPGPARTAGARRHPGRERVGARGLLAVLALLLALAPGEVQAVREIPVDYPGSEGPMPARLWVPEGRGPRPGVLVLHTILGPEPAIEQFARDLAAEGFVTLTPDLFALHEFGAEGRVDHPLVLGDLAGALAFLRGRPEVHGQPLGVVGFSFGARLAVLAAALHPELRAVVAYYGVASFQALARHRPVGGRALASVPLTERVGALQAPVLLHYGEADGVVPPEQGRLLHEALRAAGKASTLWTYPGADHRFNFPGAQHHPEAARQSWERTVAFLRAHLSSGSAAATGLGHVEHTEALFILRVRQPFDEVLVALEEAIQRQNYFVASRNDLDDNLRARARARGIAFEYERYKVVSFCNLTLADEALRAHPFVGALMPCRVAVFVDPGSREVVLVTVRPTFLARIFPSARLHVLARQVEQDLVQILRAVAGE
jgi:carboxymethylenebutenolidase